MEQKHRSEFPEKELWDLTALYQDREDFLRAETAPLYALSAISVLVELEK